MLRLHESQIPMLTDEEIKAISLLKEKLRSSFTVRKLILFGSKARGDYNKDSDVDIMVLIDEPRTNENRDKLSDIQYDVITEIFDAPLMCSLENYGDWVAGNLWIPLKDNIEKEGTEIEI